MTSTQSVVINPSVSNHSIRLRVPGDKSISHRAIILGALATNSSTFDGFLESEDCLNTLHIFSALGVPIQLKNGVLCIDGVGLKGLTPPHHPLDCGNSGTGIRLITGVLAAQSFDSIISGDASIQTRPMKRIIDPLSRMGARVSGVATATDMVPPLVIHGGATIRGIDYAMGIASAQVKSSILLAGLYADGVVRVTEPRETRDHTERLIRGFGGGMEWGDQVVTLHPAPLLNPHPDRPIQIPGDFSSAAFFLAYGAVVRPIELVMVGMNPTRTRFLDVLNAMGARIECSDYSGDDMEPYATIRISPSELTNIEVPPEWVPNLIDEIPILAILALFARGELVVRQASELRVKESDRIQSIAQLIQKMGGLIETMPDGLRVTGGRSILEFEANSNGDHRIAMAGIMGGLMGQVRSMMHGVSCVSTSFPTFFECISDIGASIEWLEI